MTESTPTDAGAKKRPATKTAPKPRQTEKAKAEVDAKAAEAEKQAAEPRTKLTTAEKQTLGAALITAAADLGERAAKGRVKGLPKDLPLDLIQAQIALWTYWLPRPKSTDIDGQKIWDARLPFPEQHADWK